MLTGWERTTFDAEGLTGERLNLHGGDMLYTVRCQSASGQAAEVKVGAKSESGARKAALAKLDASLGWLLGRSSANRSRCGCGDAIVTPAEVEYAFEVLGDESALVVCVVCPRSARSDH
jgi:hypothetical protein